MQSSATLQTAILQKFRDFSQYSGGHGVAHKYGSMFKVLANIMEKSLEVHADQSIVDRILAIMDRIEENLSRALSVERAADAQREADYLELTDKVRGQVLYITN